MKNPAFTRRHFIKQSALAGIGLGLMSSTGSLRGDQAPNQRIRTAAIGVNARGARVADAFASLPGSEIACICDVDSRAIERARKVCADRQGKMPRGERDFRRVLEDPEIDAVMIATPDHWHAPMAILAIQAGKHVYVEKPCSHNPREGELLVEAAQKYNKVVQMGNQRRSWPGVREAIELVQNGEIGEVHHSRSWYANARAPIGIGKQTAVPDWLDYELWQGPAPRRPFQDNILHYHWHWFWNWGTGEAGNNAIHSVDLSRWGLNVTFPTRVTSSGGRYYADDDWETPDTQMICWEFEGGKQITWEGFSCNRLGAMGSGFGVSFHGDNGSIVIEGANDYRVYDKAGKEVLRVSGEGPPSGVSWNLHREAIHAADFLNCIRNGGRPVSNIEEGHASTLLVQLGNIAQRAGGKITCDPKTGRIQNNAEAVRYWSREYEPGWEPKV